MELMTSGTLAVINAALSNDPIVSPEHRRLVLEVARGDGAERLGGVGDRVLSRKVVAELMGVTTRTVTEYARMGVIRPIRLGAAGARATGYSESSVRAALHRGVPDRDKGGNNGRGKR